MTDLHATVTHRLAELRAVAEAAEDVAPSPWTVDRDQRIIRDANRASAVGRWKVLPAKSDVTAPDHAALWSPAHSLRWIEWAEGVARRHAPTFGRDLRIWCEGHADLLPWHRCEEIPAMARALGIEVTE